MRVHQQDVAERGEARRDLGVGRQVEQNCRPGVVAQAGRGLNGVQTDLEAQAHHGRALENSAEAATSPGASVPLAPAEMMMLFSPWASRK